MPQAATHILAPLVGGSIVRDYFVKKKDKKKFPLHYILILGIAGIIPDLDVALFWVLSFFGFGLNQVHRTFLHTIYIPLIFFIFGLIFYGLKANLKGLGKHKLRLDIIFFMISLGCLIHLILDALLAGYIRPLYPLSDFAFGLDVFSYLPKQLIPLAAPCLDAGLLIIWLIYLEWKHKISDFI
jgi:membrane-bound metal-dependent hydrolase YbcI (DUF457 family)